ncbi:YihY/virulence factor BrkB family protein [Flavobacterium silvaticum]|uniref:YihY/virulence factor BrkB family protein n=1 Tax=Flavobacterium silvaticum TaxID=1852020 RepID=A0A972FTM1_9FLAO|nr:YihY/virulence factor BrkB family protein [Flavobacterium silvaticum]NMH27365.1 YihY/virulence factor BrkB family protein [Flavobacterium silvaticum]
MFKSLRHIQWKDVGSIFKRTFQGFVNDRALKLSASLSYYTVFSMAPLILLVISLAGFFLGEDAIRGHVFHELNGLLGNQAAAQLQEVIKNMELSGKTTTALVIGVITLIVGATSVFGDIQDSINIIWRVKAKPKRGWVKILKDRLLSSSLIIGLGFLMVVTLLVNGALVALNGWLQSYFPEVTMILFEIINIAIGFGVIWLLFSVIFKVLPDAEIRWKHVRLGAFFTALLFMLGRYLISIYIQTSGAGSAYGAAGSLIVILVWVYYTAAILYFGAEFTRAFTEFTGAHIKPSEFAVYVEEHERERDVSEIPPKEIVR